MNILINTLMDNAGEIFFILKMKTVNWKVEIIVINHFADFYCL